MATYTEIDDFLRKIALMMDHKAPRIWASEKANLWGGPLAEFTDDVLTHVAAKYPERNKWMPKLSDLISACQQAPGELRALDRQTAADAEGCPDCQETGRRIVAVHTIGGTGRVSDVYDGARWHRYSARCDCPLGKGFSDVPHDYVALSFPEALAVLVTDAERPRLTAGGELAPAITWDDLRANLRTPSLRRVAQRVLGGNAPSDPVAAVLPEATQ